VAPFVRTVRTASGATAVQIVYSNRGGRRDIEHVGSAHGPGELEVLRGEAARRLRGGQGVLDLEGLDSAGGGPYPIVWRQAKALWDVLEAAYRGVGFTSRLGDEVFKKLVLARVVEPSSKLEALNVLSRLGVEAPSYSTVKRALPRYADPGWRDRVSKACGDHVNVADLRLCLYDVTTLYFEIHEEDDLRKPGFSKERRLEPQILVGLLTGPDGFPLHVGVFEGNKAETKTMLPVLEGFRALYPAARITVVADAGMMSEANLRDLEDASMGFVVGAKIPSEPFAVLAWRKDHPGRDLADGQVFAQPTTMGPDADRRERVTYYQWRQARARRDLRGIEKKARKAAAIVAGLGPASRNQYVTLSGGAKRVNQDLIDKHRAKAGLKAYITNLLDQDAWFVIDAYHNLFEVEKSFRISKHDLQARPVYHHKRQSIEAHVTIVFAALAVSRHIEQSTGWSIRKVVKHLRDYRTEQALVGSQTITIEDPLPDDLAQLVAKVKSSATGH
jgi:hypothetical protein